jgi:hypothetical protein
VAEVKKALGGYFAASTQASVAIDTPAAVITL